ERAEVTEARVRARLSRNARRRYKCSPTLADDGPRGQRPISRQSAAPRRSVQTRPVARVPSSARIADRSPARASLASPGGGRERSAFAHRRSAPPGEPNDRAPARQLVERIRLLSPTDPRGTRDGRAARPARRYDPRGAPRWRGQSVREAHAGVPAGAR